MSQNLEKGSMLRVMFLKKTLCITLKKCQVFESVKKRVQFVESYSTKKSSILRVLSEKGVQFFESYQKKSSILWVIFKKVQFFEGPILCVIFKKLNCSIHCVIFKKKKSPILWLYSKKKGWILWVVLKKIQFLESNSKKSILWILIFF